MKVGVENQTQLLTRFVLETDVDCIMIAGRYTPLGPTQPRP